MYTLFALVILTATATLCRGQCRNITSSDNVRAVSDAVSAFSWNVYKEHVTRSPNTNLILAGLGIEAVMALVSRGARGSTRAEVLQALQLPDNDSIVESGFQELLSYSQYDTGNASINVVNAAFLDQKYSINEDFKSAARNYFKANISTVDFARNFENVRVEINNWVANNTKNLIREVYGPGEITSETKFAVLNAMHFSKPWNTSFVKNLTTRQSFYTIDGNFKDVDMMYLEGEFWYRFDADLNAQIIELPYKGGDVSMVVVLPSDKNGLHELESKISCLKSIHTGGELQYLRVGLPRFEIKSDLPLTSTLSNLNMRQIFSSNADLSRATNSPGLFISDVRQKAVIKVTEEGTEAAAVSGAAIFTSLPPQFYADHSFLYYVRHVCSDTILFSGRYTKPE